MIERIKHNTQVPILGEIKTISFEEIRTLKPRVLDRSESLHVYISESSSKSHREHLDSWLRNMLKSYIEGVIQELNLDDRFSFNRLTIKNVSSRWGSCSSKRNLNFNLKLIFCPLNSIDYVVIHELCHLVEMNHSRDFWNLVESIMPNYKVHQDWLKKNGVSVL